VEIIVENVATGWPQIVAACRGEKATRISTRHGISFDLAGLSIIVLDPHDRRPPADFVFPELITDYASRLFGEGKVDSLLDRRLRRRNTADGTDRDQLDEIRSLLRAEESTRGAVFDLWDVGDDLGSEFPVSPVGGCFRVIEDVLWLFLTVRSVDVMLGLVPELLAFARVATDMALDLRLTDARLHLHCWSAHLYEIDFLTPMRAPR
jgi:thymidylate synthase